MRQQQALLRQAHRRYPHKGGVNVCAGGHVSGELVARQAHEEGAVAAGADRQLAAPDSVKAQRGRRVALACAVPGNAASSYSSTAHSRARAA